MGIEEKIDRYLKEAKTKGVTLPKDVDKMSDKDIKQSIEKTAKLSDSKIEKNQDIVNKQMDKFMLI
ncbi:MAG: hypothetical protein ACOC2U_04205 [bacterium]